LAHILESVDEKLGLEKDREKQIRELAGWLSQLLTVYNINFLKGFVFTKNITFYF